MFPGNIQYVFIPINELPLHNQDLETNIPKPVTDFVELVRSCDAFIFASPENNHLPTAAMKNAIDWASRPIFGAKPGPLDGKVVGLISGGGAGGFAAQQVIRHVAPQLGMIFLPKSNAGVKIFEGNKFNEQGELNDAASIKAIQGTVDATVELATVLHLGRAAYATLKK